MEKENLSDIIVTPAGVMIIYCIIDGCKDSNSTDCTYCGGFGYHIIYGLHEQVYDAKKKSALDKIYFCVF